MTADTPPPVRTQRENGEAARQAILDAASQLMAERGYEGTSLAALVAESGIPTSSIYWHFSSKEGVLAAVMERGASRFFASAEVPAALSTDPEEEFRHRFVASGMVLISDPEQAQFLQLQLQFRLNRERYQDKSFYRIVELVRQRGVEAMHRQIATAYASRGEVVAERIASRLDELAVAMIDGIYLSARATSSQLAAGRLEHAAELLVTSAAAISEQ